MVKTVVIKITKELNKAITNCVNGMKSFTFNTNITGPSSKRRKK